MTNSHLEVKLLRKGLPFPIIRPKKRPSFWHRVINRIMSMDP